MIIFQRFRAVILTFSRELVCLLTVADLTEFLIAVLLVLGLNEVLLVAMRKTISLIINSTKPPYKINYSYGKPFGIYRTWRRLFLVPGCCLPFSKRSNESYIRLCWR